MNGDRTKIAALRELIGQIPPLATKRKGFTPKQRQAVYDAQRGECAECRCSLEDGFEIDHIRELADGGSNEVDNLQALCVGLNGCHSAKTRAYATRRAKADRNFKADNFPAEPSSIRSAKAIPTRQKPWPKRVFQRRAQG